jgi:hypothetical protein
MAPFGDNAIAHQLLGDVIDDLAELVEITLGEEADAVIGHREELGEPTQGFGVVSADKPKPIRAMPEGQETIGAEVVAELDVSQQAHGAFLSIRLDRPVIS